MVCSYPPAEGGATRFKHIDKTVRPETGKLIAWNSLTLDGRPNDDSLHAGLKVRHGMK